MLFEDGKMLILCNKTAEQFTYNQLKISFITLFRNRIGTKRHGYSAEILSLNIENQVITLQFAHIQIGTKMEQTKPLPWSLAAVLLPWYPRQRLQQYSFRQKRFSGKRARSP